MPIYTYKAMTKDGLIVRNKVEAQTKQSLYKILKSNEMLPIAISNAICKKETSNKEKEKCKLYG